MTKGGEGMEQMSTIPLSEFTALHARIAVLEERVDMIEANITTVGADVRAIRDVVVGAKGFWAVAIGAVTFLAALGGIMLAVLPLFNRS